MLANWAKPPTGIFTLQAVSEDAKAWELEFLPVDSPETQLWCGAMVIEPRSIDPILDGIAEAGLTVDAP